MYWSLFGSVNSKDAFWIYYIDLNSVEIFNIEPEQVSVVAVLKFGYRSYDGSA